MDHVRLAPTGVMGGAQPSCQIQRKQDRGRWSVSDSIRNRFVVSQGLERRGCVAESDDGNVRERLVLGPASVGGSQDRCLNSRFSLPPDELNEPWGDRIVRRSRERCGYVEDSQVGAGCLGESRRDDSRTTIAPQISPQLVDLGPESSHEFPDQPGDEQQAAE